jgi:hypothetical protein
MDDHISDMDDPIDPAAEIGSPLTSEYAAAYPTAHQTMVRQCIDDLFTDEVHETLSRALDARDAAWRAERAAIAEADAMRALHDRTETMSPGSTAWDEVAAAAERLGMAFHPLDAMAWALLQDGTLAAEAAGLERHIADLDAAATAAEAEAAAHDLAAAEPRSKRIADLIDEAERAGRLAARRMPGYDDLDEKEQGRLSAKMAQAAVTDALDFIEPWPAKALDAAKAILGPEAHRDRILMRAAKGGTGAADMARIAAACTAEVARVEDEIARLVAEEADDADEQRLVDDATRLLEPRIDHAIAVYEDRLARGDVWLRSAGIPVCGPWAYREIDRIQSEVFADPGARLRVPTIDELLAAGVVDRPFVASAPATEAGSAQPASDGSVDGGSRPASGKPAYGPPAVPPPSNAIPSWDRSMRETLFGIRNQLRESMDLPHYRHADEDEYHGPE